MSSSSIAYIISIYTLLLFLDKKNIFMAVLHGIATAEVCIFRSTGPYHYPDHPFLLFFQPVFIEEISEKLSKGCVPYVILSGYFSGHPIIIYSTRFYIPDPIGNYIKTF